MHRFGTFIAALTLGALAALPLPAQAPTDLADVCKVLGDAKLGQWASFDGTGSSGVGKLRLAVVGSERWGDSTLYWFEVSFAGKDPGKSGVVQILDRKSTRLNSSHGYISYAVFCLKKKNNTE